jgi:hypothetical protein
VTQRLLDLADQHWVTLDGQTAMSGIDLLALPLDRFLNSVYHYATDGGDAAALRRFDTQLWMPPPGVEATRGPWSPEAETSTFQAVKAALGMRDPTPPPSG